MGWGHGNLGGGSDKYSTLPPPVTELNATGGNKTLELTFKAVGPEYDEYLGDVAYIVVVKKGSIPQSPADGEFIAKLNKNGEEIR